MGCIYKLNLEGKGEIEFINENELNRFLIKNQDSLKLKNINNHITLSIDKQKGTLDKLDTVKFEYKKDSYTRTIISPHGDFEKEITSVKDSIGTTALISTAGKLGDEGEAMITPLSEDDWWKEKEKELLKSWGVTTKTKEHEDKLKEIHKAYKDSWEKLTNYGIATHSIAESVITGRPLDKDVKKHLTDEQIATMTDEFTELISKLKAKHGDDAQFLSEVPIKSLELSDTIMDQLKAIKGKNITSINGVVDLMVVDKEGIVHIYDFKVSRRSIGNWDISNNALISDNWHSTKKNSAALQLTMYKAILEQYGLKVNTVGVIPIKLDVKFDESADPDLREVKIESLEDIRVAEKDMQINMRNTFTGWIYDTVVNVIKKPMTVIEGMEMVEKGFDDFNKLFPNHRAAMKASPKALNFDRAKATEILEVKPDSHMYTSGSRYYFQNKLTRKPSFFNTKKEAESAFEIYFNERQDRRLNEVLLLADNVESFLKGDLTIDELTNDQNTRKREILKRHFLRYNNRGWTLMKNQELNAAGVFILTKDDAVEIVLITNTDIGEAHQLSKGTTIHGEYLADNSELLKVDALKANGGNLDLMKVMFLLNANPDLLKGYHINSISALNIWNYDEKKAFYANESLSELLADFKLLISTYNRKNPSDNIANNIDDVTFNDDFKANQEIAFNFIDSDVNTYTRDMFFGTGSFTDHEEKIKWLESTITNMRRLYYYLNDSNGFNPDDPVWVSYVYLLNAHLRENGHKVHRERDAINWFKTEKTNSLPRITLGSMITSVHTSDSQTIAGLGMMMERWDNEIRHNTLKDCEPFIKMIGDFFKVHANKLIGNEAKLFKDWFVKDKYGKIHPDFKLKDPDDKYFDSPMLSGHREPLRQYLHMMNMIKFRGDETKVQLEKDKGEFGTYYDVPLMRAKLVRQIENKGIIRALKGEWKEALNIVDVFESEHEAKHEYEKGGLRVYNKFDIDSHTRNSILTDLGVENMETDLERIFLNLSYEYNKESVSNDMMPMFQGLKMVMALNQALGMGETINTRAFLDKYMKVNIYNEPIIEDDMLKAYRLATAVKSVFGTLSLAFNFSSMFRELAQGTWVGVSRVATKVYHGDTFTFNNWLEAQKIILSEAHLTVNNVSKLEAISYVYGFANADSGQLPEELRNNKTGIRNINSNTMFWTARNPDFLHRMSWLIARMIKDGCYDAHTYVMGEGLKYDFNKDKRFEQLIAGNKDHKDYAFQKALYEGLAEQLNIEGIYKIDMTHKNGKEYGDPLPAAYTNKQATGLRNTADMCYGHYDKRTQMMVKNTFIGAFSMQYKTFLSAKVEQWFLAPKKYNMEDFKQVHDDDGVKLFIKMTENPDGTVDQEVIREDEIKSGDVVKPYLEWQGAWMEGIAYSMMSHASGVYNMIRKGDVAEWTKVWNDPIKRANLKLFFWDMGVMAALAWFTMWLAGGDWNSVKELPYLQRMAFMTMYGSFQDGPIHNIIAGTFGDMNPPVMRAVEQFLDSTGAIISGNQTLWEGVTKNVGLARSMKSFTTWI